MKKIMMRRYTMDAGVFTTYPELAGEAAEMCRQSVDYHIEKEHGEAFGDHSLMIDAYEYDVEDEETGEMVHIGPLVDIVVKRAFRDGTTGP